MEEQEKVSQYNEAMFQLQRLHVLWMKASNERQRGQLNSYAQTLISAQIELLNDAKKLDKNRKTKYLAQLRILDQKILDCVNAKVDEEATDSEKNNFLKDNKQLYFNLLCSKESLLREIQDNSGKGGKYVVNEDRM